MNEVEELLYTRTEGRNRILDYGAGDGRLKHKFLACGFKGKYETLDISSESLHTYASLAEIVGTYDAIFCLEVIEHMSLNDYVELMDEFQRLLKPCGLLAVSTPNPLCVVPMWAQDAWHIQQFPLADLAADFVIRGYDIEVFRVRLGKHQDWTRRAKFFIQRVLCYLLNVDYAHGLLIIGKAKKIPD
jgi:2-polyprenyl-3-methyl-5-hydroxy-6-metoxy-1,4-benzoquinol methylase